MTQPAYVPITEADQVRPGYHLRTPPRWQAHRPAEHRGPSIPGGSLFGRPGPDQGYAYKLFQRLENQLVLEEDDEPADVRAAVVGIATRRAAMFGRAPILADLEHAAKLWGLLGGAPKELVEFRQAKFKGVGHDYMRLRSLVASIPEESLRAPGASLEMTESWRKLLGVA